MKLNAYIVLVLVIALGSCNGPTATSGDENSAAKPAVSQADQDLMKRAQEIFQKVPLTAELTDNPITAQKVKLGKLLYYDTRLSKTGNNSCNSCHNLATYGVDNLPTSKGDAGKFGERNSPTVLNAALHASQFWDGRAKNMEEQAGLPILNPVEMGIPDKAFLVKKLKGIKQYQDMFKEAYPTDKDALTYDNLEKSIAAFERTLITPSDFDKFLDGHHEALTAEQKTGLKTFMDVGCSTCHSGVAIGGAMFQKFGVYADYRAFTHSTINDEGRKKQTKLDADKDMFKVPGLRNVANTYPYFHDGSVKDLAEAVKIMGKAQLNKELPDAEVTSIIAFLKSLTGPVPVDAQQKPQELAAMN